MDILRRSDEAGKKEVDVLIDVEHKDPDQSHDTTATSSTTTAKVTLDIVKQPCFPPAPYPLTWLEQEAIEQLIAGVLNNEIPRWGNGHIERRIAYKELRKAFAPPGDPHESYLIKGDQLEKIGRTKEFGYPCTCWRSKGETCQGYARKRMEEEEIEKRHWKQSTRSEAIKEKSALVYIDH